MLGLFSHCRFIDTRRTQVAPYQVDCKSRAMVFEVFRSTKKLQVLAANCVQRQGIAAGIAAF